MIITDIDDLLDKIHNILIEVGQSDPQFKLGDWITYKPHEVRQILEERKDELTKLIKDMPNEKNMKHGKWVEESRKADGIFDLYQTFIICSICGNEHYYGTGDKPNFCDKCGAKMDSEE